MLPWVQQASLQMGIEQAAAWGSVWQLQGSPKFHSQWTAAWFFKSASEQELDYRMSSTWHKPWQRRLELPVPAWASSHTHPQFCSKATPTPALALQSPAHTSTFPSKVHHIRTCPPKLRPQEHLPSKAPPTPLPSKAPPTCPPAVTPPSSLAGKAPTCTVISALPVAPQAHIHILWGGLRVIFPLSTRPTGIRTYELLLVLKINEMFKKKKFFGPHPIPKILF